MKPHGLSASAIFLAPRIVALILVSNFYFAGQALARNCTAAEKTGADAQLWLNKRDKAASLKRHLPWRVPGPAADRILVQRDYVIGYSDALRVPLWTAHRLDGSGLGKESRVDCFRADPRIPASAAAQRSDFDEPIFDQGHFSPNGDFSKAKTPVINSFILSNMAPQHCQMNRGVWQILESLVRIWATEQGSLYVITGSIFDQDGDGERDADSASLRMKSRNGKERVAIPSHFYKVLVRELGDGRVESLAFMIPNDQTNLDGEAAIEYLENHLVALDEIEKVTGIGLLPGLTVSELPRPAGLWTHTKAAARSLAHNCPP